MRRRLPPSAVVVTGGSRGIGLEAARRFAAAGHSVGLIARDRHAVESAAASIDGTAFAASADVADADALAAAIAAIEAELGPTGVLVNNAGIGAWGAVVETDPDVFRRTIDVNYLGAVHATAAVLPGMLERGRGRIVNVGSIAGRIGAPFEAAYSASKFALTGYTEALAVELDGTGVSVSLVSPGPVDTEFFDRRGHAYGDRRPRPVDPGQVAHLIVKAADGVAAERFAPRWLRFAHAAKVVVPVASRIGTRRMFADERRDLRARVSTRASRKGHGRGDE